jgi:hypothetical protein
MRGGAREGAGAPIANNNAGRGKVVRDAFRQYVTDNPGELRLVIMKCFTEAQAGNMTAAGIIFDRIDGKAPQALTGGDEGDAPLTLRAMVELVRPAP